MQFRHNFGPENGPQNTVNTDFSLRTAHIQGPDFSDRPVYSGADLVGFLRWWAAHYDWDKPDIRTTRLRVELTFEESVTGAFYQFIGDGQNALASLMKDEFAVLMEMTRSLDLMYAERIDTLSDMRKLEEIKSQVGEVIYGLATMLENGYRTEAEGQEPEPSGSDETSKTEWITYQEAAELLLVDKSTICRWAQRGILESNGKKGRRRRVSKGSVLIKERQDAAD